MAEAPFRSPSLRALLSFRAAATHARLAEAAESLGVTESAVSHQLRQLEDLLQVQLFDRGSGRLTLTETGRRYLARIDPALREIEAATREIAPAPGGAAVRLTLPPSLAAIWLIPRLRRFEDAHPDIELQLVATTRRLDMARDRLDAAIRYGRGGWPDVEAERMFDDLATPVAAPGLVAPAQGAPTDSSLGGLRLLVNNAIPDEWTEWARAHGLEPPSLEAAVTFDSIEQALEAARAGHGLAMGRSPHIEGPLARGEIVAPFGAAGPTGAAYYLCLPRARAPVVATRRLARWLRAEASAFRAERALGATRST